MIWNSNIIAAWDKHLKHVRESSEASIARSDCISTTSAFAFTSSHPSFCESKDRLSAIILIILCLSAQMLHCGYLKSNLLRNAWWHNPRAGDASLCGMQVIQSRTSMVTCSVTLVVSCWLWCAAHGQLVRNVDTKHYPVNAVKRLASIGPQSINDAVEISWLHKDCADRCKPQQTLFQPIPCDQQTSLADAVKHFWVMPSNKRCRTDTEICADTTEAQ